VFTSNCMEYRRSAGDLSGRQRLHSQQSTPTLNQSPLPNRRVPAPYSSPLPQTQWAEVPLPYRPRDYPDSDDELYESIHNSPAPAWYLRPPETSDEIQTAQAGSEARRRRQGRGLRNLTTRNQSTAQEQSVDAAMLYPQMNPYTDRTSTYSTYSAPEILEHYHVPSIVRVEPPSYPTSSNRHLDLPPTSIPRSPTYPPATRRRGNSTAGGDDNAFTDEEEFHLFVQATAGLGPDVAFRHSHPMSPTDRWRAENDIPVPNRPATTGDIGEVVSPLGDTPTAVYGLAQLPQMPERHQHSLPRRERAESVTPGLNQWLNNPAAALTEFEDISPVDDRDDELPDYAQSQAEAQAHQRAEATRRAQELQRRWQMSGSRRGI
jgi:hypothetical protein